MVTGRPVRGERAGLRIDRLVAVVAIAALGLSTSIAVRVIADRIAGTNLSTLAGISLLAPDDTLVTFEDFELGAPGWDNGQSEQSDVKFGGMLGRFGGTDGVEAVSRSYSIPDDANYALVSFNLHAIDDWALEDVIIFANGVEVLRQNFSTRADMVAMQRSLVADLPWLRARLEPLRNTGIERGFANGQRATHDQSFAVRMVLAAPPEDLRIGFGATLPADAEGRASWAIDNLQIITTDVQPDL